MNNRRFGFLPPSFLALAVISSLLSLGFAPKLTATDTKNQNQIAVGDRAPNFKLKNGAGESQELSAALKRGTVALVFYRSADW